jgi:L-lysine 2,3-aminomutase
MSPDQSARPVSFTETNIPKAAPTWKTHVIQAIRDPAELCSVLGLSRQLAEEAHAVMGNFPLLLPRTMLARITPGNAADPVLRQFLPTRAEAVSAPGFSADPLEEQAACPVPGVLAKYEGRILILATSACPVHCRYCFRRHLAHAGMERQMLSVANPETTDKPCGPGAMSTTEDGFLSTICRYLESRPDCREVIFSGGEPLLLDDETLREWFLYISQIPHVLRIRIHTRLPVVIPQRVTPELIDVLHSTRLLPLIVLHINHPQEIDETVSEAISRLAASGILLLCQSVLLAGVNDAPETLAGLYERLAGLRVLPYYLHQLDRVLGAHHFDVPIVRGREIVQELRRRLPGYLVPRYVQELPGEQAKVPL